VVGLDACVGCRDAAGQGTENMELIDRFSNARSVFIANLWVENHISIHVFSGLVVLAMADRAVGYWVSSGEIEVGLRTVEVIVVHLARYDGSVWVKASYTRGFPVARFRLGELDSKWRGGPRAK